MGERDAVADVLGVAVAVIHAGCDELAVGIRFAITDDVSRRDGHAIGLKLKLGHGYAVWLWLRLGNFKPVWLCFEFGIAGSHQLTVGHRKPIRICLAKRN